jgi:hypothetical protein
LTFFFANWRHLSIKRFFWLHTTSDEKVFVLFISECIYKNLHLISTTSENLDNFDSSNSKRKQEFLQLLDFDEKYIKNTVGAPPYLVRRR